MRSSELSGLLVWYAIWIFALWPFDKFDFSSGVPGIIGTIIGGFWWAWLPLLVIYAAKQRRKKKGAEI